MTFPSPLRLSALAGLLALHVAAQAAPAAPVAVSFDTTPRAGQHQRQSMEIQAVIKTRMEAAPEATEEQRAKVAKAAEQMAQAGALKMSIQMQQTMKVGQPGADGWLPLTVESGNKKGTMQMGDKVMPLPNNRQGDMSITARFNPKDFAFEIQNFEGGSPEVNKLMSTQGQSLISQVLQLSKALSQRALKVGESVDVPLTMALPVALPGGAGGMQGLVHYTLARVEKGVAHFDLSMTLDVSLDAPLPSPPVAASAASAPDTGAADAPRRMLHMVMTGSGKGTSSLRLADRLPLASQMAMDMKMTMDGPDNARVLMDMDMVTTSKGESLARPAAKKKP